MLGINGELETAVLGPQARIDDADVPIVVVVVGRD